MNLRTFLFFNKIKQREFARRIGVSNTYIYNICHGRTIPSLQYALKIEKETEGAVTLYDWTELPEEEKVAAL